MKTYKYIKADKTTWWFFYDRAVKLWTVFEVDSDNNNISSESDYFHDKKQMIESHGFDFNTQVPDGQ